MELSNYGNEITATTVYEEDDDTKRKFVHNTNNTERELLNDSKESSHLSVLNDCNIGVKLFHYIIFGNIGGCYYWLVTSFWIILYLSFEWFEYVIYQLPKSDFIHITAGLMEMTMNLYFARTMSRSNYLITFEHHFKQYHRPRKHLIHALGAAACFSILWASLFTLISSVLTCLDSDLVFASILFVPLLIKNMISYGLSVYLTLMWCIQVYPYFYGFDIFIAPTLIETSVDIGSHNSKHATFQVMKNLIDDMQSCSEVWDVNNASRAFTGFIISSEFLFSLSTNVNILDKIYCIFGSFLFFSIIWFAVVISGRVNDHLFKKIADSLIDFESNKLSDCVDDDRTLRLLKLLTMEGRRGLRYGRILFSYERAIKVGSFMFSVVIVFIRLYINGDRV